MLPCESRALQVADAPIDVTTATQTDVSPRQRPVVVTLVHGTVLFARWPRVPRLVNTLTKMWSRGPAEPAWHRKGSPFWDHLSASLGPHAHLTSFCCPVENRWDRIFAAGAEGDFGKAAARSTVSLREQSQRLQPTLLVLPGARGAQPRRQRVPLRTARGSTARAVDGLVCLSTPFVHARERVDSGLLDDALKVMLWIVYLTAFLVRSSGCRPVA